MTTTTYHIRADGTRGICGATKRACRYSNHTTEAVHTAAKDETELNSFFEEMQILHVQNLRVTTLKPPADEPTTVSSHHFMFDDEIDYYTEPHEVTLVTEPEYIDVQGVLADLHGVNKEDIPNEYTAHAKENKWDAPENFVINRYYGYYGEVFTDVTTTPELTEKVTEYYRNMENATDSQGVLQYCRSKGQPTAGMTPIEALKAQLSKENKGKKHKYVDHATNVWLETVRLEDIRIPAQKHYDRVEPRKPEASLRSNPTIAGVVRMDENRDYVLVDGYHRTKFLNESGRYKKGKYFVLTNT